MARMATCHPDRLHLAKGLCSACYQAQPEQKRKQGEWYVKNRASHRKKCNEWKKHNLEKFKEYQKHWYENGGKEHVKEYQRNNQGRIKQLKRNNYLRNKEVWYFKNIELRFGLSKKDYLRMKSEQKSKCFICHREIKLVVDHDHMTGKVRALLCVNCNSAVGHSEKSGIFDYTQYIEKFRG